MRKKEPDQSKQSALRKAAVRAISPPKTEEPIPDMLRRIAEEATIKREAQAEALKEALSREAELLKDNPVEAELVQMTLEHFALFRPPSATCSNVTTATTTAEAKLGAIAFSLNRSISALENTAFKGEPQTAHLLAESAIRLVRLLNELATCSPESFATFASKYSQWPVLKSPHRYIDQNEKTYFESLKIGSDNDWVIDSFAQWKLKDEAGKLAIEAFERIQAARNVPLTILAFYGQHCSKWENDARALPPFKEAPEKWNALARRYLEQNPEKLTALCATVKYRTKKSGGISSAVWEVIRKKFLSMSGEAAQKAKGRKSKG